MLFVLNYFAQLHIDQTETEENEAIDINGDNSIVSKDLMSLRSMKGLQM